MVSEPLLSWIPDQSPGAALVAVPSPFVSPPAPSSRNDVNTTGDPAVPIADNVPSTVIT